MVQKGKFTKHYFEGSSRIVSKLGEGTFSHKNTGIMAGGLDYLKRTQKEQEARDKYIRGLNVPPGPPTQHGIYATPEWTGQPYPSIDWESISQNQEPPAGWPRYPRFNEPGDVPGPPVQFGEVITNANVKAGHGFIPNGVEEKNLYYYHPDHLGSSSYITDKNGEIVQHTEYMAFGEVLVDEHSTSNKQPYLFNGKELDFETGLYYYGARYYDAKTSLWLNTDPLMEKYPEVSPYTYTLNNPIMLIDPDGNEPYCPSCKTKEDWDLYRGYWDNSISMMGGNMYLGTNMPSHIKVLFIDGNIERPYVSINGQLQDNIEELKNRTRLDVFSEFFTPIVNIPEVVISKVGSSLSKGGNWFTRNIINPIKSLFSSNTNELIEPVTNTIYKRPNNATTPAQRASVQGKECVTCGKKSSKMVADHKTPLVQEHYRTGTIDKTKMKSLEAVQPQCPTCSSKQGAEMSRYSQEMKRRINERTNGN